MRIGLIAILLMVLFAPILPAEEITVSILVTAKQGNVFNDIFKMFSKETGITIKTVQRSDKRYKEDLPKWLLEGKGTPPDVLYWQASQRLFFYVQKGVIRPITHIWNKENLDKNFSHVKSGVTYEGEVYALPISFYHWGIFYKKSLIEKYGDVPQTWNDFIVICEKLKNEGISPIGIGTKNNWPAAAWFDYINLRINGLEFHQQLLMGKVSFYDKRVQSTLLEWKKLIDKEYFIKGNNELAWYEVLPYLYRDKIGFVLLGNFVNSKWPSQLISDIGFIPFPIINEDVPRYEEAPMDIFMIPKSTKKIKEAEEFIKFFARGDVQSMLNERIGCLPPNKSGSVGQSPFIQAGANLLNQAEGISQYFDRDTLPEFDKKATPILSEFINSGNLEKVTHKLEQARKEVFE